ncbi:MAG: flavoprotein [Kiritimatiellia bacterium]
MNIRRGNVILGVTGSIAAYKAVELLRLLRKDGYEVRVVMTPSATRFVGELTFRTLSQHPVLVDMFAAPDIWEPAHIAWAQRAAVMLIAPCTANVLAKLAHGLADDALTATALACEAPLIVAPAMNSAMWRNAATLANVRTLRERGVQVIDPVAGEMACGTSGPGRMPEPPDILRVLRELK